MRPDSRSDAIFGADGDIVGVKYPFDHEPEWKDTSFHMGFVRVKIEVFRRIPAPWFDFTRTQDGTALKECECKYFKRLAETAGFTIGEPVGYCDHDNDKSWCG